MVEIVVPIEEARLILTRHYKEVLKIQRPLRTMIQWMDEQQEVRLVIRDEEEVTLGNHD